MENKISRENNVLCHGMWISHLNKAVVENIFLVIGDSLVLWKINTYEKNYFP